MRYCYSILSVLFLLISFATCKPSDQDLFKDPADKYRPMPFWHINGELTTEGIRQQIRNGNLTWGLSRLNDSSVTTDCTQVEQLLLKDLEITQKYMQRVINKSRDDRYNSASFNAQANLLTGGILRQMNIFFESIEVLHDKSGQTSSDLSSSYRRDGRA